MSIEPIAMQAAFVPATTAPSVTSSSLPARGAASKRLRRSLANRLRQTTRRNKSSNWKRPSRRCRSLPADGR